MPNNNRTKGHSFERYLVKLFREMGYKFVRTSRAESKLLDDCGVDLTNLPFNVQAKNGYKKARPKYEVLYAYIKGKLKDNYPPENELHDKPIILVHKLPGGGDKHPELIQWTFNQADILPILAEYSKLKGWTN